MVTIGSLVLVTCNLIGASMSSSIWYMPFEEVWAETTHACVFFYHVGWAKGELTSLGEAFPYDVSI